MNPVDAELSRLRGNWRAERDGAALYAGLARLARNSEHRDLYRELAAAEERHAQFWEERLRLAGASVPTFRRTTRTLILVGVARYFGVGFVMPAVVVREVRERDGYCLQADAHEAGLAGEEYRHAAALRRHADAGLGNSLRAAVLGANDGLTSNFCLMMGVAGAGVSTTTLLVTGVAGLLSGACAMALGEWLSVTNARELALSQMEQDPGTARGAQPGVTGAVDATRAAVVSFLLFAGGALCPLLPFALLPMALRVPGSVVLSVAALALIGVATSLFNGRSAWLSALRQVIIGCAAAAVIFAAGRLFQYLAGPG